MATSCSHEWTPVDSYWKIVEPREECAEEFSLAYMFEDPLAGYSEVRVALEHCPECRQYREIDLEDRLTVEVE